MAKEIFRIEDNEKRLEVHRCLYPTPRFFIFRTDKLTGKTITSEQSMTAPWQSKLPIAGAFPVVQTAMTETVQTETDITTDIVWNLLSKLTKESANKPSQAQPNPKKPESKKPASKIPKSDPFEKAGKKRSTQRWDA